jgi:hypothetical protein
MRDYLGNFEIHLTVQTPSEATLGEFQSWCRWRDFKCLHIVLARGAHTHQPMASWRRKDTSLRAVTDEARCFAADLKGGFAFLRLKVEADADNKEVPQNDADALLHPAENYFEHHIKLLRPQNRAPDALIGICEDHGAHLSHNAFREPAAGMEERFVTLRCYRVGRTSAEQDLSQVVAALNDLNEHIIGQESEYCVYDSNLTIDAGWLSPLK